MLKSEERIKEILKSVHKNLKLSDNNGRTDEGLEQITTSATVDGSNITVYSGNKNEESKGNAKNAR